MHCFKDKYPVKKKWKKKYILTNEKKEVFGKTLFRIKALISFGNVKVGELGGFIEKENNLGDVYDKVLECDKKTCAKEKKIFYTNLFRIHKNKKIGRLPKPLVIEDLPDKEMIEIN